MPRIRSLLDLEKRSGERGNNWFQRQRLEKDLEISKVGRRMMTDEEYGFSGFISFCVWIKKNN